MKLQICDSNSESVFCNRISHPHSFAPTFLFAKNFCIWQFCILLNFELRRSKLLHPSFHFSSQSNDFDEYFFSWRSRDFRNFYFVGRIYLGRFVIGILFSFNGSDFVIRIIFEEYLNFWCDPFFFFFFLVNLHPLLSTFYMLEIFEIALLGSFSFILSKSFSKFLFLRRYLAGRNFIQALKCIFCIVKFHERWNFESECPPVGEKYSVLWNNFSIQ